MLFTDLAECLKYDPNPPGLTAFYNYFLDLLSGTVSTTTFSFNTCFMANIVIRCFHTTLAVFSMSLSIKFASVLEADMVVLFLLHPYIKTLIYHSLLKDKNVNSMFISLTYEAGAYKLSIKPKELWLDCDLKVQAIVKPEFSSGPLFLLSHF